MKPCKYAINDCPVAKTMYVTSEAECSQQYGSNAKVKLVKGVVIGVVNKPTQSRQNSWQVKGWVAAQ